MFRTLRGRLGRIGRWPRLILAAACVLLAANSAASAHQAEARRRGVAVVVAAHALADGHVLRRGDVRVVRWPVGLRPAGTRGDPAAVAGHRLAGAVTGGEPITPARLLGPGLTSGLARGLVAFPVTVSGARVAELVRAGDRVDLLALPRPTGDPVVESGPDSGSGSGSGSGPGGPTSVVASRLLVLSVLRGAEPGTTDLVVATDRATGLRLTQVAMAQVLAAVGVPP